MPIGAGFTPAIKHQKHSLFELERGRKAGAYVRHSRRVSQACALEPDVKCESSSEQTSNAVDQATLRPTDLIGLFGRLVV
jgi:hypothetical protein